VKWVVVVMIFKKLAIWVDRVLILVWSSRMVDIWSQKIRFRKFDSGLWCLKSS